MWLDRLTEGLRGTIVAKLEYLSPGGSKKDRVGKRIVADAERSGRLRPGQLVVELTSGNSGAGLAIVCAVTGHPFVAVLSKGSSAERARMIRALGAEAHLRGVALDGYVQISGERARATARLLAAREGIFAGYSAGANVAAALHLLRTDLAGATIAALIPDSGLKYLSTELWE